MVNFSCQQMKHIKNNIVRSLLEKKCMSTVYSLPDLKGKLLLKYKKNLLCI